MRILLSIGAALLLLVVAASLAGVASSASAQQSSPFTPAEQAAVKALVLQAIREHPEIVVEALQAMKARSEAEAEARARETLRQREAELLADPNAPVIGNPSGDVTVVEFFDYNCPYCKRAAPEIAKLIADDPKIRVVMREWPILGPDSVYAARAALAARAQGKYREFHEAMMRTPRANEATVRRVAEEIGLDLARLATDMEDPSVTAHLALSDDLASGLGISGTPGFVIGDTIVPGYVAHRQLQMIVEQVRAKQP